MLARFLKTRPVSDHSLDGEPPLRAVGSRPRISPLAMVDPKAHIGDDCEIGPFCSIGPNVTLGSGCKLISHVVIMGDTTIGCDNTFFPHCVIGGVPQDKKYRGERTELLIGNNNTIRESVTIHLGTVQGGGVTRVGDNNLLMVNAHLGHDCQVGNNTIIANNVMLAGHVVVGNNVVLSGGVASHHYVTIGDFAFVAGLSRIHHDVPPFMKVADKDKIRAINAEGLRRAGFSDGDIEAIEDAGRKLFFCREKPFAAVLADFDGEPDINLRVRLLVEFLRRRDSGRHGRYLEGKRPPRKSTNGIVG